jgi:hypothetical protein
MDWIRVYPLIGTLWHWWRSLVGLNRDHDIAVFNKLNVIATEQKIDDILNGRIYTSDLRAEDVRVIDDLIAGLQRIENQYLDATIQLRAGELAWDMEQLMSFVARTFFLVPGSRLKFHPDPIDPDVFDTEWKELNVRLEKAWEAYKTYREAVKERLMV